MLPEPVDILAFIAEQVTLIADDDLRALGKLRAVLAQLRVYRVKVLDRVAPLAAGDIDQMREQTAAVDVPQEVMAKPRALGCSLNDARDIRHDKGYALIHVHDPEVGEERSEMVVCDLGMRLADDGQERRLADVREADKADVRQQLQLKRDIVALAGKPRLCKARNLARRRGKMHIAPAAAAAFCGDPVFTGGHIVHDRAGLGIAHYRAAGDFDIQRLPVLAVAALALTVHAVAGRVLALISEVHQCGHIIVNNKNNVAAAPAIAPVGAAGGDVLLAMKRNCAVPALAGVDTDARLINKR